MTGTDSVGGICTGFEKTCCPEPAVKAYTVVMFTRRHGQDLSGKVLCVGAQKTDDKSGLSHCGYLYVKCIARVVLMTSLLVTAPAKALGPVDGEVGVFTWVVDDYQDTSVNSR